MYCIFDMFRVVAEACGSQLRVKNTRCVSCLLIGFADRSPFLVLAPRFVVALTTVDRTWAAHGRAISEKKVAKDSKKGPKLDEEAAKKNKLLPKYALAAEALLAAYPDEDGKPVYVGDKDGAAELLEPGNILGRSAPKNTEMLSRPGFGIAFAVTSMRWGNQTAAALAAARQSRCFPTPKPQCLRLFDDFTS